MKFLLLLSLPLFLYASSLKSLLEYAIDNNNLVLSRSLNQQAKQAEVDSKHSAYYPTLDVGANYQSLNGRTPFYPGDIYGAGATLGLDIYDGGRKSSQL